MPRDLQASSRQMFLLYSSLRLHFSLYVPLKDLSEGRSLTQINYTGCISVRLGMILDKREA
jgi:hypothetical protein